MKRHSLLALTLCGLVAACDRDRPPGQEPAPPAVTIMTFNVQNLFDNVDDPGKDDATFLPLSAKQSAAHKAGCAKIEVERWRDQCLNWDWSEPVLKRKLAGVAAAILQVNDGHGADIIALQEVENAAIVDRLSFEYLGAANYGPSILIEGDDERGIDVAFLSRLPLTEAPVLHPMTFPDYPDRQGDTRGILEATFLLPDGTPLTGLAVHFPAPFHPVEMRVEAYRQLNLLRSRLPPDHAVFAAGDFNTVSAEMVDGGMLDRYVRPTWQIAHELCDGCPGTYYYPRDDNWSFLDMILFAPPRGEKTTWRIRADSVRIRNRAPEQVTASGTPKHYDGATQSGVSDHWPLSVTIELAEKQ